MNLPKWPVTLETCLFWSQLSLNFLPVFLFSLWSTPKPINMSAQPCKIYLELFPFQVFLHYQVQKLLLPVID